MRSWVIGGVILLFVMAAGFVWIRRGGVGFKSGAERGFDDVASRSKDGSSQSRRLAIAAMRDGRFDRAYEYYRSIPDARWKADDCFELGKALLARDRLVLGWAALEAARRIDPQDESSMRGLDSLRGKLTMATGGDRSRFHEAASRVELLGLIGKGPPLGLFVLGLARYADAAGEEDELLDRLGSRDHSLLRAVQTNTRAMNLTARLLMETARTAEAVQLLDPLVDGALRERGIGTALLDAEAAWLLSRAALQLDQHERADRMLGLAGGFGATPEALPEPSPFVGSRDAESVTRGSTASNKVAAATRRRFVLVRT